MTDINSVNITGRLTADPDVKKTQSGLSVARFTVATSRRKDKTDFISCVAWRQVADFLGQYAHKGDLVGIKGWINTDTYERDGRKVYITEVTADELHILASKGQNARNEAMPKPTQNRSQTAQNQPKNDNFKMPEDYSSGIDISSDDLPF